MTTLLIIDSSYYNYYRFYATCLYYKKCDGNLEIPWTENAEFMKVFERNWFSTMAKLKKKFNVENSNIIFVKDGHYVWRYEIYPEYKGNRIVANNACTNKPFLLFKHINIYFHKKLKGAKTILCDVAEADDIIHILTRRLKVHSKIIIITGDRDLLQMSDRGKVDIYELRGGIKNITIDDPKTFLLTKILVGDQSDNIPSIFKGCGKVTAKKLANDPQLLDATIQKKNCSKQYDLNRLLIDFEMIPENIVKKINEKIDLFKF